jgi:hypothetical protein
MVRADESGQDDLPGAVNRLGVREAALHFRRIADCGNQFAIGDDRRVPQDAVVFAKRDDNPIFKTSSHIISFLPRRAQR